MLAEQPELEVLFVDMDAYFASVEQMDDPSLRGKPIAVTPVMAASGCCIASSYEARRHGVKTGCRVSDARKLCPEIRVVPARPDRYIAVHHDILAAIDTVLPVSEVESVDECWGRLLRNERSPDTAEAIGMGIKAAIAEGVGPITCSIGVAPNRLLAKVTAGMRKPNGLTILARSELPGPLLDLDLTDFPGIHTGINRRLRAAGITSVAELMQRTAPQLRDAWGSVLGVYWWHWMRGDHLPGPKGHRRTVGHQHVLGPEYRSPERARGVALRLLAKAAQRMRALRYVATRISLSVGLEGGGGYSDWSPLVATNDTIELNEKLGELWNDALRRGMIPENARVLQVGVRLEGLEPESAQLPLFACDQKRRSLMEAIDAINRRQGGDTVYLGAMHGERKTAPRRIPFGKPPDLALPDHDR